MSTVTGKLQVTVPKAIADRYGIRPGDEIEWTPSGDAIRVVPVRRRARLAGQWARIERFDAATERQRVREAAPGVPGATAGRGWAREDLHERGGAR